MQNNQLTILLLPHNMLRLGRCGEGMGRGSGGEIVVSSPGELRDILFAFPGRRLSVVLGGGATLSAEDAAALAGYLSKGSRQQADTWGEQGVKYLERETDRIWNY